LRAVAANQIKPAIIEPKTAPKARKIGRTKKKIKL